MLPISIVDKLSFKNLVALGLSKKSVMYTKTLKNRNEKIINEKVIWHKIYSYNSRLLDLSQKELFRCNKTLD